MRALEMQRELYNLTSEFFPEATVQWGRQRGVKPKLPCLIMTVGTEQRSIHPIINNIDGVPVSCYPTTQKITIDLFTNGTPMDDVPTGFSVPRENSAVSDLQDFLNYLDSPAILGNLHQKDISILVESPVQDVSSFVQDVDVDYRARCELSVSYTWSAAGAKGFRPEAESTRDTNGSGGGSSEIASADTGYFTEVGDMDITYNN